MAKPEDIDLRQKLQERFMQFQTLNQHIEKLSENIKHIDAQIATISEVIANAEEIGCLEKGTEILVPFNNGIFIKAKIEDNKKFHVNVGSNTTVTKDLDGIKKIMNKQNNELAEVRSKMAHDLQNMQANVLNLQKELQDTIN